MQTLVPIVLVLLSFVLGVPESHAAKAKGLDDQTFVDDSICLGDSVPDDGVKAGTCAAGPLAALLCDVSRSKPPGMSSDCGVRPAGTPVRSAAEDNTLAVQRAAVASAGCPGAFPIPIAVSVWGTGHHTAGQDVLLDYPSSGISPGNPITNQGGAWINPNFIAPCPGLYMFTVSFVKDSYYYGGTQDDVSVYITRTVGANTIRIGEAWSGEGAGRRGTGAYSVVLRLGMLDSVQTWVHSDGGPMRHLADYNFTGYRIGD